MRTTFLPVAITLFSLPLLAPAVLAQANDATNTNPGGSKVRIVRLSQVKGAVEIDRSSGRGFEPAIANLPVIEQNQIRTGVGVAEIEFEDNSSLRLAPNSMVEFPSLERDATGATVSSVHVVSGTAYISLLKPQNSKAPSNQFQLIFGVRKLNL
ncbi:MAG: FecR domain-containing protein, partial [Terracidiphilus sp.]